MTPRTVAGFFLLGFAAFTASKDGPEKAPLRIANPKGVVGRDGKGTRLWRPETVHGARSHAGGDGKAARALNPASLKDRQEQKDKVEEILAERVEYVSRIRQLRHA